MMNGCIYRTEHDVCKKYTTDKATSFCVGRNCPDRKPSNSDRIRSMTDEELANMWYSYVDCGSCPMHRECNILPKDCLRLALEWLQAESGEA